MIPPWLYTLTSWFTYWLVGGRSPEQAAAQAAAQFGTFTDEQVTQGLQAAELGINVAEALNTLDYNDPLSAALGGNTPPAETVGVRAVIQMKKRDGSIQFATITHDYSWDQSLAFATSDLVAAGRELAEGTDATLEEVQIVPPTWFPRGPRS